MKNYTMVRIVLLALIIGATTTFCGGEAKQVPVSGSVDSLPKVDLNISILLDLSDRISPQKNPNAAMEYSQRDIECIKMVVDVFVDRIRQKKVQLINDNIQVYIDPVPNDADINNSLKILKQNFTRNNVTKVTLAQLPSTYQTICQRIYVNAIESQSFVGSDIWGFFKTKIKNCISKDHRNIIVVLTDGYLYHRNNKFAKGKQYSYLIPELIKQLQLTTPNWEDVYSKNGYGLIPANSGLDNVEVLILGVNGASKTPFEDDVIKRFLSDWLDNMGVQKYEIHSTDLPVNMQQVITQFI